MVEVEVVVDWEDAVSVVGEVFAVYVVPVDVDMIDVVDVSG